jgi:hypothetical protein
MTSICTDFKQHDQHSTVLHDFADIKSLSLQFELTSQVRRHENFTISVTQQGNRLGRERLKVNLFEPCPIKIILKKHGRPIARRYMKAFNNFLEVDDIDLEPGVYEVLVEPVWNPCAETDPCYKILCIDLFCKERVSFQIDI